MKERLSLLQGDLSDREVRNGCGKTSSHKDRQTLVYCDSIYTLWNITVRNEHQVFFPLVSLCDDSWMPVLNWMCFRSPLSRALLVWYAGGGSSIFLCVCVCVCRRLCWTWRSMHHPWPPQGWRRTPNSRVWRSPWSRRERNASNWRTTLREWDPQIKKSGSSCAWSPRHDAKCLIYINI